jgi:pyrimidine and pyridine-specific 5'-nucleotidase
LHLEDLIDGLIFCDYSQPDFSCKPELAYYQQAMRTAGVSDPSKIFFIDDSKANVLGAIAAGWGHCVHFCEQGLQVVEGGRHKVIGSEIGQNPTGLTAIENLQQLREVWYDIFK